MKFTRFIYIAAVLLFSFGTAYSQIGEPTTIKGVFRGYNGQEAIFFTDLQDEMGTDIEVEKDGSFQLTTNVPNRSFDAIITVDEYFMRFYVEPGGTYIFDVDLSDESKYTITGSHERENTLWKRFIFGYWYLHMIRDDLAANAGDFKTYRNYVESIHRSMLDEAYQTGNPEFIADFRRQLDELTLSTLYYYPLLSVNTTGEEVDDIYFDEWVQSKGWTSMDEKALLEWNRYASAITHSFGEVDKTLILKTLQKTITDQPTLNTIAASVMTEYLATGGKGDKEKAYAYFKTICTDPQLLARVERAWEGTRFLAEGSDAPEIVMNDTQGREYKLSELRGKVLYVDVWATWCGPCKKQIPYFAKLAEQFKGDGRIEFVSISIDDNVQAWKKMVAEEDHYWPQFIVEGANQSDFTEKYQITGIPRFMLFDQDGRVISVNAPSPSKEDMDLYLQDLLDDTFLTDHQPKDESLSSSFGDFYGRWRDKNRPAPDFVGSDIEGRPVRLSDYRGKVVILDFWFTTCHMCIKGFPALNDLAAKYKPQDLVVIAACTPEKKENFEKFVNQNKDKYPDLIWIQDRSTDRFEESYAMKDFGMFGAPCQVIIDREGIVVSATNFKEQIICALPLAGINVDPGELDSARAAAKVLEDRMNNYTD